MAWRTPAHRAGLQSAQRQPCAAHASAVQNIKFSRELFTGRQPVAKAALNACVARGGSQAMITVVSRGDMEAAMKNPEQWGHLMVRGGGFSARFIDLPREAQLDLLRRTLY